MDRQDRGGGVKRTRERLKLIACTLPLITVGCWVLTIFVPVLDSGEPDSMRIRVTSLGVSPIDMNELAPLYLVLWTIVLTVAITGWLCSASSRWSVLAIVMGAILSMRLIQMIADPPFLLWDGQTADGLPTGGMEVAYPAVGFGFWVLGSLAFVAAGICGLVAASQTTRERRARIKRCMLTRYGTDA